MNSPAQNASGKTFESRKDRFPVWFDSIKRPPFSPEFWTAQEAIIQDENRSADERSLVYWKRHAWGNARNYAAGEDGHPLTITDCAAVLGVAKSRVSEAFKEQKKRGEVYTDSDGRYCPIRDPQSNLECKEANLRCSVGAEQLLKESTTYRPTLDAYVEDVWMAAHPAEAAEWTRAEQLAAKRAELKAEEDAIRQKLRPLILNGFKAWRKHLQKGAANGASNGSAGAELPVPQVRNENEDRYGTNGEPIIISSTVSTVSTEEHTHKPEEPSPSESGPGVCAAAPTEVEPKSESPAPQFDPKIAWEAFRALYPKDARMGDAMSWWLSNVRTKAQADEIIQGLIRHLESADWERGIGIPYAITFLSGRRYIENPKPGKKKAQSATPAIDEFELAERFHAQRRRRPPR